LVGEDKEKPSDQKGQMPRIKVYFAFADFLKAHSQRTTGTYTDLGYYISDYFTKPLDSGDPEGDFFEEASGDQVQTILALYTRTDARARRLSGVEMLCHTCSLFASS